MTNRITLLELRSAFERVVNRLELGGVDEIAVGENTLYWHVGLGHALNISSDPPILLGDLCEDIDRLLHEPAEVDGVSYNYVQSLASLIQFVASGPLRQHL